jgi:hypothetical protein
MPRGRKLNVPDLILDMEQVQEWFAQYGTVCESFLHKIGDEPPAEEYYQTTHSFVFLCGECNTIAWANSPADKTDWDGRLAEHMYDLMCRRSYVQTNLKSDFMLEEIVAQRAESVRQIEKLASTERAAEQQEIRKHIRESPIKVGTADDEILVARQRQTKREQAGTPRLGPARVDRGSVLRTKLIVPALPDKKEGE